MAKNMTKVLFVCVESSCRSQMAEGFAKKFGEGVLEVYSAGSRPSGKVNPEAIKVVKEASINISSYKSKGFNELPVKEFDYVITLGCQDLCPFVLAKEHIEWQIDDPANKSLEFFREVWDDIKNNVKKLIENIQEAKQKKRGGYDAKTL